MKGKTAGVAFLLAAVTAMGQTTRPAGAVPKDMADAWLGELALKKLAQAAETGQYQALGEALKKAGLDRVAAAGTGNLEALDDVVYVINACQFLPATESLPDGRAFARWLVGNRAVGRLLFRTLACDRPKANGIARLHAFWQADPKAVVEYANLAVAFATASPERAPGKQVDPAEPAAAFAWYVKHARTARFDLKAMPFELSRYLACSTLSLEERNWALVNYARETSSDRLYNTLKYDWEAAKGAPKKISALPFTLPNLQKVGGVCLERAYFSSEVYRALGVPAVMITGTGTRGGHAWLGYLRKTPDGRSVVWDTFTGRYREDQYFVGDVYDPVRGHHINDCDLSISLAALLLPLRQRENATAALQLARWVNEAAGTVASADASGEALAELAREYNALPAGGASTRPAGLTRAGGPVAMPGLAPARKLDMAVVDSLVSQSLGNNMVLNGAWDMVLELGQANRLSVERVGRLLDLLLRKTSAEHPDYGCSRALRLIATFSDAAHKADLYDRAAKIFAHRPDLSARCLIAAGTCCLEAGREKPAMLCYERAVQATQNKAPSVLMEAMRAMEKVYRKNDKLKTAVELYNFYYQKSRPMDMNSPFRTASERYRLGSRLVELLKEMSQEVLAKKIALELDPQTTRKEPPTKKS